MLCLITTLGWLKKKDFKFDTATAIFYNPETQRPEFRYACHWQPTREPHRQVAKAKVTLCSSWAPWEFSTLQSRKLRNAFSSSKIWEGHRIIEFHPWLGENWAERWLSEQNRSCSVKGEPLSESPALLLTVPRFPLIIFPFRISQTQPSLISRAQIAQVHATFPLQPHRSPLERPYFGISTLQVSTMPAWLCSESQNLRRLL